MTKKLFTAIALLAISAVLANATLVGSLHINTAQDATNVFSLSDTKIQNRSESYVHRGSFL